jgi:hypothetical protein
MKEERRRSPEEARRTEKAKRSEEVCVQSNTEGTARMDGWMGSLFLPLPSRPIKTIGILISFLSINYDYDDMICLI